MYTTKRTNYFSRIIYRMINELSRPAPVAYLRRTRTPIALAQGDGIGPEITQAVLHILEAAQAYVSFTPVQIGLASYNNGASNGIAAEAWEAIRSTGILLKGPVTTPQGGGFKSVNVTLRKALGRYANVRPVQAFAPYIATLHPEMNVVVIRENEEDVYAGIEHRQSEDVYQCLKLITRPGCERIVRYAFEYAKQNGRKKITCMTKDNIMKMTDGLFHRVFDEIGAEYPQIQQEHMIIDIGMAKVATQPERFDVIVTPNLYGDILSDVVAEISGSVGLAPSANIGNEMSVFEAIHGSAPDIAGKGIANPSGMLLASTMMLQHIGQSETASLIHNAWLRTIEDGQQTADLNRTNPLSTMDFARAVCERLGEMPRRLPAAIYPADAKPIKVTTKPVSGIPARRNLQGVDIFISSRMLPSDLAKRLQAIVPDGSELQMISNRGVVVWPTGLPETHLVDHYRCRFTSKSASQLWIVNLLIALNRIQLDVIKTENLYAFDGKMAYSAGQGQ